LVKSGILLREELVDEVGDVGYGDETVAVNLIYSPGRVSTLSRLVAIPVGSVGIPHNLLELAPNGGFMISC